MPFNRIPPQVIIFAVILLFVVVIIQVEIFRLVLSKLGLSPAGATTLLIATFAGSAVNLPIGSIRSNFVFSEFNPLHKLSLPIKFRDGYTLIAVNVGGGLIPIIFSIYLMKVSSLGISALLISILVVTLISYLFSRPVANLGIGMPLFIAPVSAAIIAMLLAKENAPALAYICGSLGVLIGADILRLKDIRELNAPIASIGGAGTFDGIFITGIIAVLLTH